MDGSEQVRLRNFHPRRPFATLRMTTIVAVKYARGA